MAKLEKSIDDLEGTDSHTNTNTFSLVTGTKDNRFVFGCGGGDLRCKTGYRLGRVSVFYDLKRRPGVDGWSSKETLTVGVYYVFIVSK